MVLINLEIAASMTNVAKLDINKEDVYYFLKVKCTNCHDEFAKVQSVELNSSIPHGKSKVNYKATCKLCTRHVTIQILEDSIKSYEAENNESFKSIVVFDCRGCDLTGFEFKKNWIVTAESGTVFEEVDLSSSDWLEYDEKEYCPISIEDVKFQFSKA